MIGSEIGRLALSFVCTYGRWCVMVVDGYFEAAMLQLLVLVGLKMMVLETSRDYLSDSVSI